MLHYNWAEIKTDPHAATPFEAAQGRALMQELGRKWYGEGFAMFQAGTPRAECWSREHRAGWDAAAGAEAQAVAEESEAKPGYDLADGYAPRLEEYEQDGFWTHEDLPLWTGGGE